MQNFMTDKQKNLLITEYNTNSMATNFTFLN